MNFKPLAGLLLLVIGTAPVGAQESPLNEHGKLVEFQRDIVPILRDKCLECHGPDEAKNDFRVDDPDVMGDYITIGDPQVSSLYTDYLAATGEGWEDYIMPPKSKGGPLSREELALISVWIQEGADWPEGATFDKPSGEAEAGSQEKVDPEEKAMPEGIVARVWMFQGFFHPATVHFPVALFLFGAIFVVLGCKWPQLAHPIPFFCLIFGAITAVIASMMGWAFAEYEGYSSSFDLSKAVNRHRWGGILVAVLAVVFSVIAIGAEAKKDEKRRRIWQIGLLLCAALVGLVGHIGGEMTYGEDFYHKAFEILIGKKDA